MPESPLHISAIRTLKGDRIANHRLSRYVMECRHSPSEIEIECPGRKHYVEVIGNAVKEIAGVICLRVDIPVPHICPWIPGVEHHCIILL